MRLTHLQTVVGEVSPIIVKPPCKKAARNCPDCSLLGKCNSPVSWCALPYYDKKRGCEKFGKSCDCPPHARIFDEVYSMNEVILVGCEFNLAKYMAEMAKIHPDWNERQLRNVIYWQGQARCILNDEVKKNLRPDYEVCLSPEAMGIDLRPVARQLGITLEFPPTESVWRLALLVKKKG